MRGRKKQGPADPDPAEDAGDEEQLDDQADDAAELLIAGEGRGDVVLKVRPAARAACPGSGGRPSAGDG